jgi:hypothetical protein
VSDKKPSAAATKRASDKASDKAPDKASDKATKPREVTRDFRVPESSGWYGAWKKSAIVGVIGIAAAAFGYTTDPQRFAFSWLFAFFLFLTVGLGALFFVLIQYITKAGWSITVRRTAEFLMFGLVAFVVLVLPVLGTMDRLFPWTHAPQAQDGAHETHDPALAANAEHPAEPPLHGEQGVNGSLSEKNPEHAAQPGAYGNATEESNLEPYALSQTYGGKKMMDRLQAAKSEEHAHVLNGKSGYLNKPFFLARAAFYVLVWLWLAMKYWRLSIDQDTSKKHENTSTGQKFAPAGLMLFAITITFASFDWLMSLEPMWFSTIFGVTIFAGACVANFATLILFTMLLRRSGLVTDAVNVEHFHDMGKLLFGWLVFWAYVSFAQFFLIWYANIPEELSYFHHRWTDNGGTWKGVSVAIVLMHFAVPFWLLMSRNVKRRMGSLALGAAILFVMHVVEIYWIVMPNYGRFAPHWLDVACFLGVGGVYFAVVLRAMEGHALIPVGDPRLVRALKFENA